jgi:hypothetical protein
MSRSRPALDKMVRSGDMIHRRTGSVCLGESLTERDLMMNIAADFTFSDCRSPEYAAGRVGSRLNCWPQDYHPSKVPDMKCSLPVLLMVVVFAIAPGVLMRARSSSAAEPANRTAADVFRSRQTWRDFPYRFIDALSARLSSAEKAKEFVILTENAGILQNNIRQVADQDPDFAVGSVATTLTSYANTMGERRRFADAKRALDMALLLKPRHLTAWMSMALVAANTNDCRTAVAYADKVLTFKPRPGISDPWEIAQAESMRPENGWNEIKGQMSEIRNLCRKRS